MRPGEHLDHDVGDLVEREAALARDAIGERRADELLHDEVGAAVVEQAEVVDLADVGVADRAGGARLLLEALHGDALLRLRRVEDLDRDEPAEAEVLGLVDRAHAALAEDALDDVAVADGPADEVGLEVARRLERAASRAADGALAPARARRCGSSRGRSRAARASLGGRKLAHARATCTVVLARSMRRPVVGHTRSAASCGILQWGHRTKRWLMEERADFPRRFRDYRHEPGASNAPSGRVRRASPRPPSRWRGHRVTATLARHAIGRMATPVSWAQRDARARASTVGVRVHRRPGARCKLDCRSRTRGPRPSTACSWWASLRARAASLARRRSRPRVASAIVLVALARRGAPVVALLGGARVPASAAARAASVVRAYERDRAHVVEARRAGRHAARSRASSRARRCCSAMR